MVDRKVLIPFYCSDTIILFPGDRFSQPISWKVIKMSSPKGGLRGGDHQDLRVLFLHELDSAPGSEKQRLLEKALGKQRVKAPNLKTRQTIMMFVLGFLVLAICLLSGIM